MPIVPAVLVTLDENRLARRDEETGGRVAREVVVQRVGLARELISEGRLGPTRRDATGGVRRIKPASKI